MARATTTPTIFYIFGGSGDLTQRKLIPALYNLFIDGNLPEKFLIVGLGRTPLTNTAFRNYVKEGIKEFARRKDQLKTHWKDFVKHIEYSRHDLMLDQSYRSIATRIKKQDRLWNESSNIVYYLSVAPQLAPTIAQKLHSSKLCTDPKKTRLVFEKPFGHDLQSAKELNALPEKSTHIAIHFKSAPSYAFPKEASETWRPNRLIINISPKMDIRMRFQAKRPGPSMTLEPVEMVFNQYDQKPEEQPEAYETLLYDIIEGDATLFMRADQVEAAWEVITPIMEVWAAKKPVDFPNYPTGSWGPEDAEALIAKDGHYWVTLPTEKNSK